MPDKFVVGYALDYNEYFRDLNVSIPRVNVLNMVSALIRHVVFFSTSASSVKQGRRSTRREALWPHPP